jgi:signal recognition particle GTPase
MFENLTERLSRTVQQLRGRGRLTEDGISATLREVRIALLEADVALPVVQAFIGAVREKALGQEILQSLTPGQAMVKLVHDELVQIMGVQNEALDLKAQPPVAVLMAGLQGSGKTTTTAKLARLLIEQEKSALWWSAATSTARPPSSSSKRWPPRLARCSSPRRWTRSRPTSPDRRSLRRADRCVTCCWSTPPVVCTSMKP